ncbi:MAG: hypothetical protein Q4E59_06445 [Bacteroidales bacterium]|nr:hypothetical protein [Bacteroidales bacterium]
MQSLYGKIKEKLDNGETEEALALIEQGLQAGDDAYLYYLKGNAHTKAADWRQAINAYLRAEELEPDGPATEAKRLLNQILEFYNKDLYNP